ncbi:MAG: hypothetical protein OXH50_05675 [Gemmatimonadetes bacterium]|nr:hypothetical protein [Gemmatimonadota bacterium]
MESQGLGGALIAAVVDLKLEAKALLSIVCYLLGGAVFLAALLRLMRSGEEGLRGPSGYGTAATFLSAIVFLTFPQWLDAWGETLFGGVPEGAGASLAYAGGDRAGHYEMVLWAVLKVVEAVGVLAFLKSWFVLRDAADGRNGATLGKAFAHMIGGVCGWHIIWVIDRVQNTLGIAPLTISEGNWT